MSILNAFVEPHRAVVGVDTAAFATTDAQCSKLVPLAHMPAIIASRGYRFFLSTLLAFVHGSFTDLDVMLAHLHQFFPHARAGALANAKELGLDVSVLDKQEVVIVGWSPLRGRMVGFLFEQQDPVKGFECTEFTDLKAYNAPWSDELRPLQQAAFIKPSEMGRLARAQADLFRKEAPGRAVGGRLITAVMNRDGVAISKGCAL